MGLKCYIFSVISVIFLFAGTVLLSNGCNPDKKIGNCSIYFLADVTVLNKEYLIDSESFGIHSVNCNIGGSYIHNNKLEKCKIIDGKNSGACGDYIHDKYKVNSTHAFFVNDDSCYVTDTVESNARSGLVLILIGSIMFLVPICIYCYKKSIAYKNNKMREQSNDLVEIQLRSAFTITDENADYTELPNDDIEMNKTVHGNSSNNPINGFIRAYTSFSNKSNDSIIEL